MKVIWYCMNQIVCGKSTLECPSNRLPGATMQFPSDPYYHFSKAVPIIVATGQEPSSCNSHLFNTFETLRIKVYWWWIDGANETDLGREMGACSHHHRRIPCLPQCLMAEGWECRDLCPISVTYPHLRQHRYVMIVMMNHLTNGRSLVESFMYSGVVFLTRFLFLFNILHNVANKPYVIERCPRKD